MGTVVALPLSGWLSDAVGWESVFYTFGASGCVWFVVWAFVLPSVEEEKASPKKRWPPMKSILTSVPAWAMVLVHTAYNWGYYTLLTDTPTHLANIQHFSLSAV